MFLDINKKKWIIQGKEYDVKENISMKEMRWFKENLAKNSKALESGKLTDAQVLEFETEWDKKVLEVGLGATYDEIEETGISSPEFRELIAEVFTFLKAFGTIQRAKLSGFYGPKTKEQEQKQ